MRNELRAGIFRRPVYFVMFVAAVLVASCYSSNYRREMLASVDLVSGLSDKLADYCRANFVVEGHPLSSEEMGEFYYGLKKARAFESMTAKRPAAQSSAPGFAQLVDAYEKFVRDADRYRIEQSHMDQELEKLLDEYNQVRALAKTLREAPHND